MSGSEDDKMPERQNASYQHLKTGRANAALKGVFWSSLNSLAPAAVGVAVFTVTSRYLTPAEFGMVAFAGSIAGLASALGPGGFGDALVQRSDIEAKHLDSVFWLCISTALIIYAVLLLVASPLAEWTSEPELVMLMPVVGARVIFDLAAVVPNSLLTRSMSFNRLAIRTTVASVISGILCITVLALGYGIWALALSQLATSFVAAIGALVAVKWRPNWCFSRSAIAELKHFGLFASGTRILGMVNVDQILIGSLLGTGPLGLFSFAQRIYQMLSQLIVGVMSSISFPLLSSLRNEHEKLRTVFISITFISSAASFPIFVGLAAVADDLIPWAFGPHWIEAIWALKGFCVLGLLTCIGVLQSALIRSQGKVDWWMWYMTANQALSALVVLVFYPYGVDALVAALAMKTCLFWPVSVAMTVRLLNVSLQAYLRPFILPSFAAIVMFACVVLTQKSLADANILVRLAAQLGVGGVAYIGVLFVLGRHKIIELLSLIKQTRSKKLRD
jgi:O-antigen/teichoic acid export membrane protein